MTGEWPTNHPRGRAGGVDKALPRRALSLRLIACVLRSARDRGAFACRDVTGTVSVFSPIRNYVDALMPVAAPGRIDSGEGTRVTVRLPMGQSGERTPTEPVKLVTESHRGNPYGSNNWVKKSA